jgi:tetratricopeptide (TPR) repeat protein
MNRLSLLAMLAVLFFAGVQTQAQEEQYVQIYNLIQEADASLSSNQPLQTLNKYLRAQTELQRFQKLYPDWNPRIVNFRLNYLAAKIAELSGRSMPAAPTIQVVLEKAQPSPTPPLPSVPPAPTQPQVQPQTGSDIQNQLNLLRDQIRQLQSDNTVLQAKVREAFSAQPAATDPRELAKAGEKIKSLQKENDLLKVSLAQEKTSKASTADPREIQRLKQQIADANRTVTEQTERANLLAQEKLALQTKLLGVTPGAARATDTDAVKKSLDEASRKLADQLQVTTQLQSDKAALQSRVTILSADAEAAAALRAENLLLKRQLADLKFAAAAGKSDDAARKIAVAQAQIAALQSDKEILRLEQISLQQQVKQLTLANVTVTRVAAAPESTARVKQLERERDDLQKKLDAAQNELASRKSTTAAAQIDQLRGQLESLRTRLAVYQAPAVPYTKEELALFNKPEQMSVTTIPGFEKKSAKELPAGAMSLVNEAQRDFALGHYEDAETKYLQVLKQDQTNIYTLANLAAIQLELNHLDESEKHLQQALATAPDDSYSLSILGNLKFRQGKFDDALDALAHAAKMDPKNAEIQNHLGLVLSQKGMRKEAETALRKSIELDPNYASAHNNLAVVYLTQKPPASALARWHYEKARSLGMPPNPQLEKMLDANSPSGGSAAQP